MATNAGSSTSHEVTSIRSRASSVFSTGTKISLATLSTEEREQILEDTLARRNARFNSRPRSLLSVTSYDRPAPPYSEALLAPQLSPTHRDAPVFTRSASIPLSRSQTPSQHSPPELSTPEPSTPVENSLAAEYSRIVRTIDENYASELQRLCQEQELLRQDLEQRITIHATETAQLKRSHEQEISSLRHNIDQAYRKDWRAKNREVERIREEAAAHIATELEQRDKQIEDASISHVTRVDQLESEIERLKQEAEDQILALTDSHASTIARERHAIEDVWEARWNDRSRVEAEEKRRMEFSHQQRLAQALSERDEKWIFEIGLRDQALMETFKSAMSISQEYG
ncbi:MAG: hypothetical protein Q9190_005866 [Brigantiaea leucoxantha]